MKKVSCIIFLIIWGFSFSQSPIIPAPVVFIEQEGINEIGNLISLNPENLPEEIKEYFIDKLINVFGV